MTTQKKSMDYYWLSKYDIMETADEEYLIFKKKCVDDPTIRIIPVEKYFEILKEVHKTVGHGGRLKMIQHIKNRLYIPKKPIELFVDLCSVCEKKRAVPRKGIVTQPIVSKDFNTRGQVDLIDLQSAPDGEFKWLMNYQDHATKFLHLRPLKSKKAAEVAMELLKIFLEFGAPFILQSDNGREFTAHVIEELVSMWPECKIIHGSPRRPQTQGSVERSNQDVENMLRCWMQDNKSTNWSIGCFFVQFYKNSSYHRIIGRSPYRALFGSEPKTILKGCNIPESIMTSIRTEEELNQINQNEKKNDELNLINQKEKKEEEMHQINQNDITPENKEIVNVMPSSSNVVIVNKSVADEGLSNIELIEIDNNMILEVDDGSVCLVCGNVTSGAHFCSLCSKPVHAICGVACGEEGYGSQVQCFLCQKEQLIVNERDQAHHGVKRAAEKMVDNTAKKLPLLEIGNSVFLNVPKIDRGPLDTKNIAGKVVDFRNGVYKIGTGSGTIKNWFSRQDLLASSKDYCEVISELPISLREAVNFQSAFGGQGFKKCFCKPAKNQCCTKRCACFKNKTLCTSKCHQSLSCANK